MIRFFDPARIPANHTEALRDAFSAALDEGRWILGPSVASFEARVAETLSAAACVGVSSGTDALALAYQAVGVRRGSRVICPAYTWLSTATSALRLGAKVELTDVMPCCFSMTPMDATALLGPSTAAIVPVHLFGQVAPLADILDRARAFGVPVIEDAAQAFGATLPNGASAGTVGALGCFSFFPTKNLGGFGDGGMVVSSDLELARRVRSLRAHGVETIAGKLVRGGNHRLDSLQAALLLTNLNRLQADLRARRETAALYRELLLPHADIAVGASICRAESTMPQARVLLPPQCHDHTFNQFVIRVPSVRDSLAEHLRAQGIETKVYYPEPLHLHPALRDQGYARGQLPVAETAAKETLALPIQPGTTREEIAVICDAIRGFLQ